MEPQSNADGPERQAAPPDRGTPEVSVIVPTYNRVAWLAEAVGSVLNQRYRRYELVVVDDGSTDGTADYLGALRAAGAARVLRMAHCGMPGAVRNRGAEIARGRYLAFLDCDDLWRHDKLVRQLALMRATGCRLSHTRELWLRNGTVVSQRKQRHRRSGHLFTDALRKCIIGPSTTMIQTQTFREAGGFREDLEIAEDYELWLRLTARLQVAYLDEALTIKRGGSPDQLSAKYDQIEGFRIAALERLLESRAFGRDELESAATSEYRRKCRIYAEGCRKHGRTAEAAETEARCRALLERLRAAGARW